MDDKCFMVIIYMIYFTVLQILGTTAKPPCYCLKHVVSSLHNPIQMVQTTIDGRDVFLIAEQQGVIHKFDIKERGLRSYIDIKTKILSGGEQGLLGFALHPRFTLNKKIYIYSTRSLNAIKYSVVSEVLGTDSKTEQTILIVEQIGAYKNGGQILFGDDGYLYIFTGVSGQADQAQNTSSLLGKILRIDVDKQTIVDNKIQYYTIPEDNPVHTKPGWLPEIYGIGISHMWRCSVDRGDPTTGQGKGRIFCGDLGSKSKEEIDIVNKNGGNYGWNFKEGFTCLNETRCNSAADEVPPLIAFDQTQLTAIVGGLVYRGDMFPDLQGKFLFGDFLSGSIFSLGQFVDPNWDYSHYSKLSLCEASLCGCHDQTKPLSQLLSFGEDMQGESYLLMTSDAYVNGEDGGVYQILPPRGCNNDSCNSKVVSGSAVTTTVAIVILAILCVALGVSLFVVCWRNRLLYTKKRTHQLLAARHSGEDTARRLSFDRAQWDPNGGDNIFKPGDA